MNNNTSRQTSIMSDEQALALAQAQAQKQTKQNKTRGIKSRSTGIFKLSGARKNSPLKHKPAGQASVTTNNKRARKENDDADFRRQPKRSKVETPDKAASPPQASSPPRAASPPQATSSAQTNHTALSSQNLNVMSREEVERRGESVKEPHDALFDEQAVSSSDNGDAYDLIIAEPAENEEIKVDKRDASSTNNDQDFRSFPSGDSEELKRRVDFQDFLYRIATGQHHLRQVRPPPKFLKPGKHGYDYENGRWHWEGDPDLLTGLGHEVDPIDEERLAREGEAYRREYKEKYPGYRGNQWPCGCQYPVNDSDSEEED